MAEYRPIVLRNGVDTFPDVDEGAMGEFDRSLTRQSEAAHTDINLIMAQYERTGTLPMGALQGMYEDVSEVGDFRTMLEAVREGEEAFASLTATQRAAFDNDPAKLLDAFGDPNARGKLEELGLIEKAQAAAAQPAG